MKSLYKKAIILCAVVIVIELGFLVVGRVIHSKRSSNVAQQCKQYADGSSQMKQCWEEVVGGYVKKGDIAGALSVLAKLYDAQASMGETCHGLTHEIGKHAYVLFARSIDVSLTPHTAYCSYGFYHGFMEALVLDKRDMQLARRFCDHVDNQLKAVTPDVTLQCFHGIGHGTVNSHDERNWGNAQALIDPALALCEEVSQTQDQMSRCATGVFNGIAIFLASGEYKLTFDPADPLALCRQQKKSVQDACYISMNTLLMQITNHDLARAAVFVSGITDDAMASHTMINVASMIGGKQIGSDAHSESVAACRAVSARLSLSCIQGYAYGFLEHGPPNQEYRKPLEFCGLTYLTESEQNACFEYILSYLPQWYAKEKVEEICASLDGKTRDTCYEKI